MIQPSVRVANRVATANSILAAVREQGPIVAAAIGKDGEELDEARCLALLADLAAILKRRTDALSAADLQYGAEQADDAAPRAARDEAVGAGVEAAISCRAALVSGLGEAAAAKYGLAGATPHDPAELLTVLNRSAGLLALAPARGTDKFGREITTEMIGKVISDAAAKLGAATGAVESEARELQVALVARDRKLQAWQQAYVGIGGIIEGLFRLAGEDRFADYLRPTARKTTGDETPPAAGPG